MLLYTGQDQSKQSQKRRINMGNTDSIAYNILLNAEDADESVNDAYMDAWNAMPHAEMHCD